MPDASTLVTFALASLLLLLVPGPAVLFVISRSVAGGRSAGLSSTAGVALGDLVQVAAATVGLSALVASSATAFDVVRYLGAAYLVWLGIRTLRAGDTAAGEVVTGRGRRSLADAVVVAALNPKTALFFLAFLPQFVDPARDATPQVLTLGAVFVALGVATNCVWAVLSSAAAARLQGLRARRAQRRASGVTLIGLGALAAASGGRH